MQIDPQLSNNIEISKKTNDKATSNFKKDKRLNTSVIVLLSCVLLLVSFGIYQLVAIPYFVKSSINKNVDIYNKIITANKLIVEDLSKLSSLDNKDNGEIKNTLTKAVQKNNDLGDYIKTIGVKIESLDNGINADTEDFKSALVDNLNQKKSFLEEFNVFMKYQHCLLNSANESETNLNDIIQSYNKLTSNSSNNEVTTVFKKSDEAMSKNIKQADEINLCYDKYSQYLTRNMKSDIQNDVKYYQDIANVSKIIIEGVDSNSASKTQIGITQFVQLSNNKPSFYVSADFSKSIDEPLKQIELKIKEFDKQDEKINQKLQSIKLKYSLN